MENNMYTRPMYKCAICDTVHETVADRMKCEQACLKRQEEEEKRAAIAKRQAEQKDRKAEVDAALKNFTKLAQAYANDYGCYEYDNEPLENVFWPNKLWHYFFG